MFKIGKLKEMVEMPNPISEDTKICEQKASEPKSVFTGQKAVQKIQTENMAGNLTICHIVIVVTEYSFTCTCMDKKRCEDRMHRGANL
jgi:hypothetical protein